MKFKEFCEEAFITRHNHITFKSVGRDFWVILALPPTFVYFYAKFLLRKPKTCEVFDNYFCERCNYEKGKCYHMKGFFEKKGIKKRYLILIREKKVWF